MLFGGCQPTFGERKRDGGSFCALRDRTSKRNGPRSLWSVTNCTTRCGHPDALASDRSLQRPNDRTMVRKTTPVTFSFPRHVFFPVFFPRGTTFHQIEGLYEINQVQRALIDVAWWWIAGITEASDWPNVLATITTLMPSCFAPVESGVLS
jgi:hypothetical protein